MAKVERCPECGAVGFDDCERVSCTWDQWDDGTKVTAKQREDGAKFADAINAQLAEQRHEEEQRDADYRAGMRAWFEANYPTPSPQPGSAE